MNGTSANYVNFLIETFVNVSEKANVLQYEWISFRKEFRYWVSKV